MTQEFNIPGLKEALADFEKLHVTVQTNAKSLLELAINAEKAVKAVSGEGLKSYTATSKTAKVEVDKLAEAQKKLVKAQDEEAKQLAVVNLQIQKANAVNKEYAKSQDESRTSLEKFNAKILESTRTSKELGAEMALLAIEGKKNSAEYKTLEKAFLKASKTSKQLNDSYRDISKTAGDNRALVGSYSTELKGHFDTINGSINNLKGNIASGNYSGAFNDARTIITGFGQAIKKVTDGIKGVNDELGKSGGVFNNLKTKLNETSKSAVEFFKPSTENISKLKDGLERLKIGFTQNADAINKVRDSQNEANGVAKNANSISERGGILSNVYSRAQILLSGATSVASGAFNILKVAIASTGIGLLIIGIGALVGYLMKLDPVMDTIEGAFAGFGGVIDFVEEKVGAFVENIKSVGDLFSKLGNIMAHPIDSMNEMANGMKDAALAAAELKGRQQYLEDQMDIASVKNKRQESEIAQLMIQAKDRSKTEAERQSAFTRAENLNNEIYVRNKKNSSESLAIAITEARKKHLLNNDMIQDLKNLDIERANSLLNQGKITKEAYEMLKKAFDNEIEIKNQFNEREDKIVTKKNNAAEKSDSANDTRQKKEQDNQKKALDLTISTMKLTIDNQIATYDQSAKLDAENVNHIKVISDLKRSIANAEMQKDLIGIAKGSLDEKAIKQKHNQELEKIDNESKKALKDNATENVKFELELYDFKNQSLIKEGAKLTDLLIGQEKDRINNEFIFHKQALDKLTGLDEEKVKAKIKANKELTDTELKYLKDLNTLEDKKNKDIKKADSDLLNSKLKAIETEADAEKRWFNLSTKSNLAKAKNDLKVEQKKLQDERELQKDNAEKVKEIDLKLAENKQKIDDLVLKSNMDGLQASLDGVIEFTDKESGIGKAAAIAKATINTYTGATNALAEYPAPYSFIVAGLTIANGLATVSKIMGINAFAVGTDNAPYTGKAIVDENGAEIHTDATGKIKSWGSDNGAHLTNIVKGDKIIPADYSAMIRQSIGLNFRNTDSIDYNKIGEQFGKHASKIVNAVNNKQQASLSVIVQKNITDRVTFRGKNV